MDSFAQAIHQIDGWLAASPRPYPIWNNGWVPDGGWIWDVPLVPLSLDQATALNEVTTRVGQSIANVALVSLEDAEVAIRNAYLANATQLDAATWQYGYQLMIEPDGMSKLRRRPERLFRRTRRLASQMGLVAYKTRLSWEDVSSMSFDAIVVAPLATQYDILRTESTVGNNYYRDTEEIIEELISIDENYGVIISGADDTALECWFKRAPTGQQAREVGERLFQLAPDIDEAPTEFRSCIALWWDQAAWGN